MSAENQNKATDSLSKNKVIPVSLLLQSQTVLFFFVLDLKTGNSTKKHIFPVIMHHLNSANENKSKSSR